jgi:Tfp pilus assembly protein PilO
MTGGDLMVVLKKHPLSFGGLIVALIFGGWSYYRGGEVSKLTGKATEISTEASRISANLRNSEGLAKQSADMAAASKELDNRLVKAGQLAINLQYFYKLESETGIKLLDVRQGAVNPNRSGAGTSFVGVPFNVSIQGGFRQVMDFLNRLETGSQFCRFNSLSFSKSSGGVESAAQSGTVSVAIGLELLGVQ